MPVECIMNDGERPVLMMLLTYYHYWLPFFPAQISPALLSVFVCFLELLRFSCACAVAFIIRKVGSWKNDLWILMDKVFFLTDDRCGVVLVKQTCRFTHFRMCLKQNLDLAPN